MKLSVWALIVAFAASPAAASELIHQFNSPSFSGVGWSSHVLTIEQLEHQRRQKIKDDEKAAREKEIRDLQATNAYKFKNNLESRIYAQLSKQISDKMFGEGTGIADGTWYTSQTPFGDTVSWKRQDNRIYVKIVGNNGDVLAEFDVPVGEFGF